MELFGLYLGIARMEQAQEHIQDMDAEMAADIERAMEYLDDIEDRISEYKLMTYRSPYK